MIPHVQNAIKTISNKILGGVLPQIGSSYVMSDTAMMSMLLQALADEAEFGVSKRLADIATMEQILNHARELGLSIQTVQGKLDSYELSKINVHHDVLTSALIELHEQTESKGDYAELNKSIWQYLVETHKRHALAI